MSCLHLIQGLEMNVFKTGVGFSFERLVSFRLSLENLTSHPNVYPLFLVFQRIRLHLERCVINFNCGNLGCNNWNLKGIIIL